MLNSWEVIVNTDLSRTVVKDINPAFFPVIMNGKVITIISASSTNGLIECVGIQPAFTLMSENWESLNKHDILALRDNTFSYRNSVCLTKDDKILPVSKNGTVMPDIMNDVIAVISEHIGE